MGDKWLQSASISYGCGGVWEPPVPPGGGRRARCCCCWLTIKAPPPQTHCDPAAFPSGWQRSKFLFMSQIWSANPFRSVLKGSADHFPVRATVTPPICIFGGVRTIIELEHELMVLLSQNQIVTKTVCVCVYIHTLSQTQNMSCML